MQRDPHAPQPLSLEVFARRLVDAVLDTLDADTVAQVTDSQHRAACGAVAIVLLEAAPVPETGGPGCAT